MTWVATGTAALTAAEIAAAEAVAVAAATAAAEAAAAQTASTALVAEAAPALTQTAATVLPEVAGTMPEATGILEAAPGAVPPPAQPMTPAGLEQLTPAGSTPPPVEPTSIQTASGPATSDTASFSQDQQIVDMIKNASPEQMIPNNPLPSGYGPTPTPTPPDLVGESYAVPQGPQTYSQMPGQAEGFSPFDSTGPVDAPLDVTMRNIPAETNPFLKGAKEIGEWMSNHKMETAIGGYMGLQQLGAFKPNSVSMPEKKTFKNQYSLSPDFKGGPYSEPNVYKPNYSRYAEGGITQINGPVEQMSANALGGSTNMYPQSQQQRTYFSTPTQMPASAEVTMDNQYRGVTMADGGIARYAEGDEVEERPRRYRGDLMGTFGKYNEMIEGKKSGSLPSGKADPYTGVVGTFEDSDVDTRLQDAYTASLIRLKKANKRANLGIAALPAGVQAGALNMPTQAAGGGIMQASLGGYATGGNPRLLSGPGDGMSDNIPATISGRQPARLADGEFVVPADVVSHLGNGSTNAGAKKLHGMMDKVRVDRTGKKKQAPAVKAGKYMPK